MTNTTLILIISSISVVISINETTTSKNINEMVELDKMAESVTDPSVEEEDLWFEMNKGDILSTSEMNEDNNPMKDFFVRYFKEPDSNSDELLMLSSETNDPITSKSIRIHMKTLEENESGEKSDSETEVETEDKSNEKKSGDDAEEASETRRVNIDENVDNKSSVHAEESSETKTANQSENDESKSSKNAKEFSEIESKSDSFENAGEGNIENPVHDDDKSGEHESVNDNNDSDKNSEKNYYKFPKLNDESHSDWDVQDDILDTRRMTLKDNDDSLENARAEEMSEEETDVSRSVPVSEYVTLAKNNNNGEQRLSHPGNVRLLHTPTGPTRRGNFYNPNVFKIQHVNPIDFNYIVSRYGTNILRNDRFMPNTRRNDFHIRTQELDRSAESTELKTIADFSSEQSSNAYPYTPLVPKISQEPKQNSHYNAIMLKLIRASENSQLGDDLSVDNMKFNGRFKNIRANRVIPPNFGLFNVLNI